MTKKYILKPGKHQFAPKSHAVHDNDNLSDEEAEWYLEKYPHIAVLFEDSPQSQESENSQVIETNPGDQSSQDNGLLNQ